MRNSVILIENMNIIKLNELSDLLYDDGNITPLTSSESEALKEKLKNKIGYENFAKQSILGIDILDYSQFAEPAQILVPEILHSILEKAIVDLSEYEKFLFQEQNNPNTIKETFIDQGDGGFFVLETPLHSLLLAIYIESSLRLYNSYNFLTKIRSLVGPIKIRYAITYDNLYRIEAKYTGNSDKYYGPALIHNARIMSKDKLDRCLIDNNCYIWFMEKFRGIETLSLIEFIDLINIFPSNSIPETEEIYHSFSFPSNRLERKTGINSIDILKIGEITAKKDKLSIFSIHGKISYAFKNSIEDTDWKQFMISLGNLNPEGLLL